MTTPKVRAAWPIECTPATIQRAEAGPCGPHNPVTIDDGSTIDYAFDVAAGDIVAVVEDHPGAGTWHYRLGHTQNGHPPVYGPWSTVAVPA